MLPSPAQPRPAPSTTATARACTERPLGARAEGSMGRRPTFLWKTGLVWPPKPACFLSYRRLPVRARRGRRRSTQRAEGSSGEGAGMARHGSGVELRATRAEAAETDGCGGRAVELANRVGSSDSASPLHRLRRARPEAA